jgi:hypothetical protein
MKKYIFIVLTLLFFVLAPTTFAAYNISQNKVVTLPKGETVEGNYYATGESVEIFGDVKGDVYAFGGQILINGNITGDLITAGGTINISGTVGQDARVAGGQIIINSKIGKNLSVAGGNIDISNNSEIGGAAQIAGGNVTISAPIAQELLLGAGNVTVNNTVGGGIQAGVGTLRLTNAAKVNGDVNYWSQEDASVDNSASVSGQVVKHMPPAQVEKPTEKQVKDFITGVNIYSKLSSIIATLIVGFILIKFYPNYSQNAAKLFSQKFGKSLGYGLLGIMIFLVAVIISIASLIGIPFAVMLVPLFIFYLFLARIYAMLAIGKYLSSKANLKETLTLTFVIGLIAYYVLTSIPFVGGLIKLVLVVSAFGAAMMNDRVSYEACRKAKIA